MSRIYVASSWRNQVFDGVVTALRAAGFDCYDFKRPHGPESRGFHWSECGVDSNGDTPENYLRGLAHPVADNGFWDDFSAMQSCDTCVLVLPCGRSAHLELGWFTGRGRRTAILLDPAPVTPELMYKLADFVAPTFDDLLGWLQYTK